MPNDTIQHADIFFFITTIAVVVGILILLVLLYMCLRFLKTFRSMTDKAKAILEKASIIADDGLREDAPARKGLSFILPLAAMLFKKKKGRKTSEK